jgi:hypothetical protein
MALVKRRQRMGDGNRGKGIAGLLLKLLDSVLQPASPVEPTADPTPIEPRAAKTQTQRPSQDPWQDVSPEAFDRLVQELERRVDMMWNVHVGTEAEANRLLESIAVISRSLITLSVQVRDLYREYGPDPGTDPDVSSPYCGYDDDYDRDDEDEDDCDSLQGRGLGGMVN